MIEGIRLWYAGRTRREQWLLLLMAAIAVPLLVWLLVVQPLGRAYDAAMEEQLEAVDRHGRVKALAEAASARSGAAPPVQPNADLQMIATESATQAGLAPQSISPAGPDSVDVVIQGAPALTVTRWLADLDARSIEVEELRMTPQATNTVDTSVRIARRR